MKFIPALAVLAIAASSALPANAQYSQIYVSPTDTYSDYGFYGVNNGASYYGNNYGGSYLGSNYGGSYGYSPLNNWGYNNHAQRAENHSSRAWDHAQYDMQYASPGHAARAVRHAIRDSRHANRDAYNWY